MADLSLKQHKGTDSDAHSVHVARQQQLFHEMKLAFAPKNGYALQVATKDELYVAGLELRALFTVKDAEWRGNKGRHAMTLLRTCVQNRVADDIWAVLELLDPKAYNEVHMRENGLFGCCMHSYPMTVNIHPALTVYYLEYFQVPTDIAFLVASFSGYIKRVQLIA